MRYYLDTEFYERVENGRWTIDLISLALVSEIGDELYLENIDFDIENCKSGWIQANVIPNLKGGKCRVSLAGMRDQIVSFIKGHDIEFWAYFGSYDWVLFCSIFGIMINLPEHFPKFYMDLKQLMITNNISKKQLPKLSGNVHCALDDAKWVKAAHEVMI